MKNTFNSRNMNAMTAISLSLVFSAFLLQGCCLYHAADVSKRPCNCWSAQPAYAANNRPPDGHNAEQVMPANQNPARVVDHSTEALSPLYETLVPGAGAINIVPGDQPGSAGTIVDYVSSKDHGLYEEDNQPDQATSKKRNKQKLPSDRKAPLGIKAISSHIIAGPNIAFKSSKEDYGGMNHKNKPGVGFQLGFGSTYSFSKHFAVSTALIFKHNRASETLSYSSGEPGGGNYNQEYKSKYSYSYLSVPILAEIKVSEQLSVAAGPEINYLLGSSVKTSGYGNEEKTSLTKSSVRLGGGVQVGVKYEIPGSPIGVQLIYDHRISRLNKKTASEDYPGGNYDIPAWNMKSVQLGVTCAICQLLKGKK